MTRHQVVSKMIAAAAGRAMIRYGVAFVDHD